MRPIYLKMSAFGPFLQEEHVDFDRLSQNGLFLITGQTGAGKTTIFDAITFALYGEASGSNRDAKTLRNDLAKEEETYVELTFVLKNKTYVINRSPSYIKEGRKTAIPAKATLTFDNGSIIQGTKEVNAKILSLLGLDVNQFKQIAMIAQGEFTKLLFANSNEKEIIFRKIFNTFKYQNFEDELKRKTKELEEKVKNANIQIETLKQSIPFIKEGTLDEYLPALKDEIQINLQQYQFIEQETTALSKQINQLEIELNESKNHNELVQQKKQLLDHLNVLEARKQEYLSLEQLILSIEKANELVPYENEIVDLKRRVIGENQQLQQLKDTLASYTDDFIRIEKEYETLPELRQKEKDMVIQAENYQQQLENRNKLQQLQQQKDKLKYQLIKVNSSLQLMNEQLANNAKQKQQWNEVVESCKEQIATENEVNLKLDALTKKINAYNQVVKDQRSLLKLERNHALLANEYVVLDEKVKNHERIYNEHQSVFFKMQAGILASTLEEGLPCPVCGSIHHPQKAILATSSISSDTLDRENKIIQKEKEERENLYQQVLKANQDKIECKNRMDEMIKANELENVTSDDLRQEHTNYISMLSMIQKAKETFIQYTNGIKQLEIKEVQLQEDIDQYQQHLQDLSGKMGEIEGNIQSIGIIDPQLDHLINNLKKEYDQINQSIYIIEENYKKMNQYKAQIDGKMKQIEISLQTNSETLVEKNNQWKGLVKGLNSEEEYQYYKKQISFLKQHRQSLENYHREVERTKGSISAIQLKQEEAYDLTTIENQLNDMKDSYIQKNTIKEQQSITLNTYQKVYQSIKEIFERNGENVKKYKVFYELYAVTKGDNPQKLSFERYILSAYFEQIILLANVRLKDMTNHRYALIRKETKSIGQSGLDLQVKDYQSGTIREVTTLSGGESFKAALSLAFGLSDMIQNIAGGIELNTLFIDEGFGSLDQESLDQAIKVLMTLNEGNKMIGIISHVTELKQRIDNQLLVLKDHKGSYIEIK